jgi:membrane peptidoglycan carboxypeptidase
MRTGHPLARLLVLCVVAGLTVAGIALPFVGGVGLFARTATDSFTRLPADLRMPPPPQSSVVLAADGTVLARFFSQDRVVVPLRRVSAPMRRAIVAVEDSRFFEHGAIDFRGTLRAAATDVGQGGVVQGGSTLTQQYVKNVLLYADGDRSATNDSIARKLREARYAITVEQKLTKRQILARYLNLVYFGEGAYGVQAAARRYFGIDAARLTVAQSALLAGLVQSPSAYDPLRDRHAARARRDVVLARMAEVHVLPAASAQRLARHGLGLRLRAPRMGCETSASPFFCDYVHQTLLHDHHFGPTRVARENALMTGGLTIHTTLDPRVQSAAQHAVDSVVPPRSRVASAVAAVRPGTGEVLAIAVDRGYGSSRRHHETRINLALGGDSGFQAGSTFKLFTLTAALAQHVPLSQTFYSPPRVHLSGFTGCGGTPLGSWSPKNAEVGEGGHFGLVRATWESVNTYFAQLERKTGVCRPWRLAKSMGVTELSTGDPPAQVPAFTLGADDTSPLQVAGAYATLAARGRFCRPQPVVAITRPSGRFVERHHPDCHRVLSRSVADRATSILRGVIDGPDPSRTGASASIGRPAAGKTGTTDSFSAAWFSGFTPQLAASVWVGDPRGGASHPLTGIRVGGRFYSQVYGADLPAAVWRATMLRALAGIPARNFRGVAAVVARDVTAMPRRPARHRRLPGGHRIPPGGHRIPPGHRKHGHGHFPRPTGH